MSEHKRLEEQQALLMRKIYDENASLRAKVEEQAGELERLSRIVVQYHKTCSDFACQCRTCLAALRGGGE